MTSQREHDRQVADELVEIFEQSGVPYTCAAVVQSVITKPAYARSPRPRRVMNLALETIHRKAHP